MRVIGVDTRFSGFFPLAKVWQEQARSPMAAEDQ